MIRLSTKTRYGLRILVQIAQDGRAGRLSRGRDLARNQQITAPYLEQIMIPLKAAGLVRTRRGCQGGYELGRPPRQITVLDMIGLFEGGAELVECDSPGKVCRRRRDCPTYPVWKRLSACLRQEAQQITLADLLVPDGARPAGANRRP